METIKSGWLYIAADGDGIGKLVGRAVIANDVDELHSVSARIDAAQDFILHWSKQVDGIKISGGGDEFTAAIPPEAKDKLKDLRQSVEKAFGYTISVGVGRNLAEAGTALLVAKLRGKDRIVYFNKKIREDIKKAKRRVREGRASQEEYKLSEAYLEKAESMLCNLHKSHVCDLHKARVDDGKTPDQKAWDRSGRNHRHSTETTTWEKKPSLIGKLLGKKPEKTTRVNSRGHAATGNIDMRVGTAATPGRKETTSPTHEGTVTSSRKVVGIPAKSMTKSEEGEHAPHTEPNTDDPCPYCADQEDARTDDCQYCQDLDAEENADGTAGMHDCDACREYDASQQNTGGIETDNCPLCLEHDSLNNSDPDNCEMCQEYNAAQGTKDLENITEAQASPEEAEDHICNCPNCPKADQTALGVEDMAAQRPDDCSQCQEMYGDAIEEQPDQTGQSDPNLQGHETAEQVLDLLDQEPGSGPETPAQEAKQIDNTEMPQGDQMRENKSVPENFGDAQKEDISDSEKNLQQNDQEEPDMSSVLQSGLDEHAQEQNKQQVLSMVTQTLQGFKANKASLEESKEQNQGLYNSCIQMLKAMIELCKLLGLEPKMPEQGSPQDPGAIEDTTQAGAPNEPKQKAPPKAAPSEGAAPDPKTQAG